MPDSTLEIIITARNDGDGGPDRLCAAAEYNHQLLDASGVSHVFTLVEWNPIEGKPFLAEIIKARLPWWHNAFVVDGEWHRRLSENPHLQVMEFFAKNVAVRRSSADVVLTTNSNVFLSTAVVTRLRRQTFSDDVVYRAERVDIDRRIEGRAPAEDLFADPRHHVRVNTLSAPYYGTSEGDFLLLTRAAWFQVRGFHETVRFAKIHKDGQFCYKAACDGFEFQSLGPIWHIDHDGSCVNAGPQRGSATAHYGSEWDYASDDHNPPTWGLSAAVEQCESDINFLRHPSTHGPALSVVDARRDCVTGISPPAGCEVSSVVGDGTTAVTEALANSRGRHVLVLFGGELRTGALHALIERLATDAVHLGVFDGAFLQHPVLGPMPAAQSPLLMSRDVLGGAGPWDETDPDAALSWWARASEDWPVTVLPSIARPSRARPALRPSAEIRALLRRDAITPEAVATAAHDFTARLADMTEWLRAWVWRHERISTLPVGIVGVDWATPFLAEAIQAAEWRCAGIFTADGRQYDRTEWGERVRPIRALRNTAVSALFALRLTQRDLRMLRRAGYEGPLHVLWPGAPAADVPRIACERDRIQLALEQSLMRGDADEVMARLEALGALESESGGPRRYEAAMCLERGGRHADALRLFTAVATAPETDRDLGARAMFHCGRLLASARRDAEALSALDIVLAHTPDHRKAGELAEAAVRRATDPGALLNNMSPGLRRRMEAALESVNG